MTPRAVRRGGAYNGQRRWQIPEAPGPTLPRHTWGAGVQSLEAPALEVRWPPRHTGLLPAGGLVPGAQFLPMGEPAGGYLPLVWFRPNIDIHNQYLIHTMFKKLRCMKHAMYLLINPILAQ